jgi:hypothetical protein
MGKNTYFFPGRLTEGIFFGRGDLRENLSVIPGMAPQGPEEKNHLVAAHGKVWFRETD